MIMAKGDKIYFFEKGTSYMNAHHHFRVMTDAAAKDIHKCGKDHDGTGLINAEQSLNRATEAFCNMEQTYIEIYGSTSSRKGKANLRILEENRTTLKTLLSKLDNLRSS